MLRKFLHSFLVLILCPIYLMASGQSSENQGGVYIEIDSDDVWYGPGFYYGIWFDNEDDYRNWRHGHRDYPSNRHYYNRDRPIRYSPGGGHEGGHGGGRDGGDHGGGGRR